MATKYAKQIAPQFGVSFEKPSTVVYAFIRVMAFVVAGASPVLAISAHTFGLAPMEISAPYLVLPAAVLAVTLCLLKVPESTIVTHGFLAGLAGVFAYDATRIPFVIAGIWPDFIPQMGAWIQGSEGTNLVLGYLWRWIGDGGGMAIVFVLACAVVNWHKHLVVTGVCYGIFVWSGLMGTILLSEQGSQLLFPITPLNFAASLTGHLIYGSVLGWTYGKLRARAPK